MRIQEDLQSYLDTRSQELGFSHYGFSALQRPLSFDLYQNWLDQDYHGEMEYLKTHAPIKEEPQKKWPLVRSALVFAVPYVPHPSPEPKLPLKQARLSLYARGQDYHFWFRGKLEELAEGLRTLFPAESFYALTDSSPVLERDLAARAGLGWIGKNTCLIHPRHGSLFFIGEIYTSLEIKTETQLTHDFCGHCRRCLDICPTQALVEPRRLDARKCISYLTIESRSLPPLELRDKIGDWLFGCDLCQTVCPWNQKIFKNQLSIAAVETLSTEQEQSLEEDLRWLLTSSGKSLEKALHGTALARAGGFGLKRNALVVVGNRRLRNLKNEVAALQSHDKLGELARWTLNRLTYA